MANFFNLEFDTTPPVLTVSLPTLVSKEDIFEMVITANEKLDENFQEILFVNTDGTSYELLCEYDNENNCFVGKVDSSLSTSQVFYIDVILRDDVHNIVEHRSDVNITDGIMIQIAKFEHKTANALPISRPTNNNNLFIDNKTRVEVGNTIRYTVLFTDYLGNPREVDSAKFKVYDVTQNELFSHDMQKDKDEKNKDILGQYVYDYIPQSTGSFWVEAIGTLGFKTALNRERLEVKFDVR